MLNIFGYKIYIELKFCIDIWYNILYLRTKNQNGLFIHFKNGYRLTFLMPNISKYFQKTKKVLNKQLFQQTTEGQYRNTVLNKHPSHKLCKNSKKHSEKGECVYARRWRALSVFTLP